MLTRQFMRTPRWLFSVIGIAASVGMVTSCSSRPEPVDRPPVAPPVSQQLWGDMKPVVSVKELMRDMIDPMSDYIFDAVSTVETKSGVVEHMPTTDADWNKI